MVRVIFVSSGCALRLWGDGKPGLQIYDRGVENPSWADNLKLQCIIDEINSPAIVQMGGAKRYKVLATCEIHDAISADDKLFAIVSVMRRMALQDAGYSPYGCPSPILDDKAV